MLKLTVHSCRWRSRLFQCRRACAGASSTTRGYRRCDGGGSRTPTLRDQEEGNGCGTGRAGVEREEERGDANLMAAAINNKHRSLIAGESSLSRTLYLQPPTLIPHPFFFISIENFSSSLLLLQPIVCFLYLSHSNLPPRVFLRQRFAQNIHENNYFTLAHNGRRLLPDWSLTIFA